MFKTILGYVIEDGVTEEEYEKWLFEIHAPDLLANPYLDRIIFNKVQGRVTSASGGTADIPEGEMFYRIAEMQFADEAAYGAYRDWFTNNPIPIERGPAGRTRFKFYVTATPTEVTRESLGAASASGHRG